MKLKILISLLLIFPFILIAQNKKIVSKPTFEETKEWLEEKLNKYAITLNDGNGKESDYKFHFEGNNLIITNKMNFRVEMGEYSSFNDGEIKSSIPINDIKEFTMNNPSEGIKGTYLRIYTNSEKGVLSNQSCTQRYDNGEIKTKQSNDKSSFFTIGFNIYGEKNLNERFKRALSNLQQDLKIKRSKKEAY